MLKGLNDFLDKHEGREVGSSTKAILKERKRQGYDKSKSKALKKAKAEPKYHSKELQAQDKRIHEKYWK